MRTAHLVLLLYGLLELILFLAIGVKYGLMALLSFYIAYVCAWHLFVPKLWRDSYIKEVKDFFTER